MNWEISIDIYMLSCVKQTADGNMLYNTGSSAFSALVTEGVGGWGDKEGGREGIYENI